MVVALAGAIALAVLAGPIATRAQAAADPEPLWEKYPLVGDGSTEPVPTPTPSPPPKVEPADREASGGSALPTLLIGLVPIVLLMLGWLGARRLRTRRDRGRPSQRRRRPLSRPVRAGRDDAAGAADVIGYISLTSAEQELGAADLAQQQAQIRAACAREGWRLEAVFCDGPRALAAGRRRPALEHAIARTDGNGASRLVVSRADRLGRSAVELATIRRRLDERRITLVSINDGIDSHDFAETLDPRVPAHRSGTLWRRSHVLAAAGAERPRHTRNDLSSERDD